jgi:hypothetical protein
VLFQRARLSHLDSSLIGQAKLNPVVAPLSAVFSRNVLQSEHTSWAAVRRVQNPYIHLILRNIFSFNGNGKRRFFASEMRAVWRGIRDDGAGRWRYPHLESLRRGVMRALDVQ